MTSQLDLPRHALVSSIIRTVPGSISRHEILSKLPFEQALRCQFKLIYIILNYDGRKFRELNLQIIYINITANILGKDNIHSSLCPCQ